MSPQVIYFDKFVLFMTVEKRVNFRYILTPVLVYDGFTTDLRKPLKWDANFAVKVNK